MGTWSHRILDDDLAAEVVNSYLERLYEGASSEAATQGLIAEYGDFDVDERSVFWLSLARIQLDYGRLVERVKREAIAVIDSGEDLLKWKGDKRRARVLAELKRELAGPPAPPKKLPKRVPALREGDVFRLRLDDGRYAFGRVLTTNERAFYRFASSEKRPPLDAVLASEVLFVVGSTDDGFASRKWAVLGNKPLEDRLKEPVYFFHQAVGDPECTVFDIWDPERTVRRPARECAGYEQWGAWSAVHCRDRIAAALKGEDCQWIPRGR